MRKHMLRNRLQQIVKLMALQYCVILFLILCGATMYGIRTDNWLAAAEIAEVLSGAVTFFMPVAYLRVRNLMKAYYDGPQRFAAEIIIPDGSKNPVSSGHRVVGRVIDMPCV